MKKIILLIIILIFLIAGCTSLYNLNSFVLPDDMEFLILIEELDTPEKICEYMKQNFTIIPNPVYGISPYQLYIDKVGDCDDFAIFAIFIASHHGYECYQIRIWFKNIESNHSSGVYKKDDSFTYSSYAYLIPLYFSDFREIAEDLCMRHKDELSKYIVYDYYMKIVEQGYNN